MEAQRWDLHTPWVCSEYNHCLPPPPPPPPAPAAAGGGHHGKLPNIIFVVAAVLSAFLLLSLTYLAVFRRFRGRRGWLRRPIYSAGGGGPATAGSPPSDEDVISVDDGAEQPLHHVWYIRTVGLDDATINSIAVTEYRSSGGGGCGSAADCSVCLGEFTDGEFIRLLPKCGHAFHVPCIDTWLRAHVNCPLCRALVVDPNPQPTAATDPSTEAAAAGSMDISNESSGVLPDSQPASELPEGEQNRGSLDCVLVIDAQVSLAGDSDSSPESSEARGQTDPENLPALESIVHGQEESLGSDGEAKEAIFGEESTPKSKGRQGNCSKGGPDPKAHLAVERSLSSTGRGFIFSRHGRYRRNSSLPL